MIFKKFFRKNSILTLKNCTILISSLIYFVFLIILIKLPIVTKFVDFFKKESPFAIQIILLAVFSLLVIWKIYSVIIFFVLVKRGIKINEGENIIFYQRRNKGVAFYELGDTKKIQNLPFVIFLRKLYFISKYNKMNIFLKPIVEGKGEGEKDRIIIRIILDFRITSFWYFKIFMQEKERNLKEDNFKSFLSELFFCETIKKLRENKDELLMEKLPSLIRADKDDVCTLVEKKANIEIIKAEYRIVKKMKL